MLSFTAPIPVSLYIHIPWCIRKCPYCDFNSHQSPQSLPEKAYLQALLNDFDQNLAKIEGRPIQSIFIGGGTPSLFSGTNIKYLLDEIRSRAQINPQCEVTLEANPGTVDQQYFAGYRAAGVNRLSIGAQSFQDKHLKLLGRIHHRTDAIKAIELAHQTGFSDVNLDLMYGLPQQSIQDAIEDLQTAISLQPTHLSWYQLTIEPNTAFYKHPPPLPDDDQIAELEQQGRSILSNTDYSQYEVSAYSRSGYQCQHNLNYWQYGDYLGIGAGAHSKITAIEEGEIKRYTKQRIPATYLNNDKAFIAQQTTLSKKDISFEFMLNALRLQQPISIRLFSERSGLSCNSINPILDEAVHKEMITLDKEFITVTAFGRRYLNDLIAMFL